MHRLETAEYRPSTNRVVRNYARVGYVPVTELMEERGVLSSLFPPTYRLLGVCVLVGVCGAFAALVFDELVGLAQKLLLAGIAGYQPPPTGVPAAPPEPLPWESRWWIPVVTTLGGLLGGVLVYWLAPEAEGHGTDAAINAYHQQAGTIRRRVPAVKAVASALTIGSGGIAGKEGPTAQIAVGLGAVLASRLHFRGQERRILLLASMAAGLAAIFRAPLGMAIFAVEILYSGMVFESEALIYTVISAVTAYAVHGLFVGWSPVFTTPAGLMFKDPVSLLVYAVLGIAAGLMGAALPNFFYRVRDFFRGLPGPPHLKPALGGLIVGLLGMVFPPILGTGYGWMELALAGRLSVGVMAALLLLKGPAMSLTIGSGGSGGVFGPTVVIGAMLGGVIGYFVNLLAPGLQIEPASLVLVGMAALFAGAARTPISTLIMVAEMTGGYGLIVPAMLSNILSFLVQRSLTEGSRYPTLYISQVPSREDSPAHRSVLVRRALRLLEDGAVDPKEVPLPRLVTLLRYGEPLPVTRGEAMLVSVVVKKGSTLDGRTIADALGNVPRTTAVAVLRGPELIVPRGPTRLRAEDQLVAVTDARGYEELRRLAGLIPAEDGKMEENRV
ncbi:MAG TPA: chloride channel protein [Acidobacteriota bacterium]|nr:chloride channel protein [Acidobacteriota bacterium]